MKITHKSMYSKKRTAVLLHIIFLGLMLSGISMMYLNSNFGKGLTSISQESFEDTSIFSHQLQKDVEKIFYYVQYREVFETNGQIDFSKPIAITSSGPNSDKTYTLDEIIRYAKTRGYYLNDRFKITGQPTEPTKEDPENVLVEWKAYQPNQQYSEPGDAYCTLDELALEVLTYLGDYYSAYYSLLKNPTNLTFQIMYRNKALTQRTLYTNSPSDLSIDQLKPNSKYIYITGNSIIIDSNITPIPKNISPQLESYNPYDSNNYDMILSVDTNYPLADSYARESLEYQNMRTRFIVGLIELVTGLLVCIATLYFLILVSGYKEHGDTQIRLHSFDCITTESGILLCVISTFFALFLGEKIGYSLLYLITDENSWYYSERLLRSIIIYGGFMLGSFSMLRRYKARTLWSNSTLRRLTRVINLYFTYHTFTVRLILSYLSYLLCNTIMIGVMTYLIYHWIDLPHQVAFAAVLILWIGWNTWCLHRLYLRAILEDKISDAIHNIASGDTTYKIKLEDFSGKEKELADKINNIGIGMEAALQEQVKSERLKADLITNVSHDIKTPLTSIINYVDLIKREHIQDEKIQGFLDVLEQKSQRLKTLTEDLVEASKASSGNLKLEIGHIDIVELIQQTTGEFKDKFATRHLELVTQLPNESIIIEGDGRRLWRILENLYNNAFKYSMQNSRVYVSVERLENQVSFIIKNISDTPLNINSDELTERFVRGDVARTTEGSGLGLSIAKSLTELQKGSFSIDIDGDLFKVHVVFPVKEG